MRDKRGENNIMYRSACFLLLTMPLFLGCSSADHGAAVASAGQTPSTAGCSLNGPLLGGSYDVTKSRFAFGTQPMSTKVNGGVHWVGSDGALLINTNGSEGASLDANAPENSLPGWSSDASSLTAHVVDYWETMGVEGCQVANTSIGQSVGGGGPTDGGTVTMFVGPASVYLGRGFDGVPVQDSFASATFDVDDQTTAESFYWPEIPAGVASAAVALKNQLADPTVLAAYKAKLPADAQGDGHVVIHHSSMGWFGAFQAAALYYSRAGDTPERRRRFVFRRERQPGCHHHVSDVEIDSVGAPATSRVFLEPRGPLPGRTTATRPGSRGLQSFVQLKCGINVTP